MQWLMLQQDHAEDFVIATGVQYSVREFISKTAQQLGVTLTFEGEGVNEVAKVASGAAETVPYFMVTNLARTLNELKERNIWIIGTSDAATSTLQSKDRVLNGAAQPDIPETELKRQVETKPAVKAEDASKPVEKGVQ